MPVQKKKYKQLTENYRHIAKYLKKLFSIRFIIYNERLLNSN